MVTMAPPVALSSERHGAGGRHPRREAPHHAERASAMRDWSVRARVTRGGREPGGVPRAECGETMLAEAGDG